MTLYRCFGTGMFAMLLTTGCYHNRGEFGLLSPDQPVKAEPMGNEVVVGTARFSGAGGGPVFQQALEDALRQAPGADVLLRAKLSDEGKCVYVSGFPAKMR